MNEKKQIDLEPGQWKSKPHNPHEPFFGSGIWEGIAWLIGFSAVALGVRYFL